jgi:DNA-binding response OmpR family regulator
VPFQVLIVDDEACTRLLVKQALRASGIDSIEATSGAEAIEVAARRRPGLVILDVMLPDCSGFDVVERWRAEGWLQPVLMLTSCAEIALRVRGLSAGADDYLVKPFDVG